jgi:hypothetical protein
VGAPQGDPPGNGKQEPEYHDARSIEGWNAHRGLRQEGEVIAEDEQRLPDLPIGLPELNLCKAKRPGIDHTEELMTATR